MIEDYQVLADEIGVLCFPRDHYHSGQRVRITEGPLENQIGVVEGMDAQQRVSVLLSILGRESRVHCPVTLVAAV